MAKVHLGPSQKLLETLSKHQTKSHLTIVMKLKSSIQASVFKTKHSNTNALKPTYTNLNLNMLENDCEGM